MNNRMSAYSEMINSRLKELFAGYSSSDCELQRVCVDAMEYSLSAGGKRIRPVLVLEFCRIYGGDIRNALDTACALEMIHTFSLIHDDLPCMDDDDMRRGKPSCHKAFDEAVALLAGDALENYAFEVISSDERITYEQRVRLVKLLSEAVGICGMIGGQVIDIQNEGKEYDNDSLLKMYSMKTGALIKCACRMGAVCAGHYDFTDSDDYAENLGLAFQIVDDILDVTADEKTLGKPVNSDKENNKATYTAVWGIDRSKEKASILTAAAIKTADRISDDDFLKKLTEMLLERNY